MVFRLIIPIGLAAATMPWYNSEIVERNNKSFAVDYDHSRFLLDGEPFQYISGSIHYFRIHREQWKDRLKKVRSLGFNAIQYYIPWNFHENFEGQYDFSGIRDFVNFTQLAYKQGLFSLVRVGPYVCGEWENGGLPWWILKKSKTLKQRSSDEIFKEQVVKWFDVLLPMLKPLLRNNGGPVLMVQIENEYGSYDACDRNYTIWLRDLVKNHLGNDTVLYTTDGNSENYLKCGYIPGVLPTVDFGVGTGQEINQSFIEQQKFLPNGKGPLVNSEFYPGWLAIWGQKRQNVPGGTAIAAAANWMYKMGANINFYMIHGGTNFGFWNGAEVDAPCITSYDYSAPLTEAGDITMNFNIIRMWIKRLKDWKWKPTAIPPNSKKSAYGRIEMKRDGNGLAALLNSQNSDCVKSEKPMSFEDMDQPMGYVTYKKRIHACSSTSNLSIPLIKDFGYIYLEGDHQGTMVNKFYNVSVNTVTLKDCEPGNMLYIVVENQGRQTYETINDYKGILSDVYLDNEKLTGWVTCTVRLPLDISSDKGEQKEYETAAMDHGVFRGEFTIDEVTDTFIDTTGWGKGSIFINEHPLGRYWATQGPQYTLYVPYPLLKKGKNQICVLELEKVKKECIGSTCWMNSVDEPKFIFEETKIINDMNEWRQMTTIKV